MSLTTDQEIALTSIIKFITSPIRTKNDVAAVLYSAAGCGKSYLTGILVNKLKGMYSIAGVAPTHKARKVLEAYLNKDALVKISTFTVASLLNKMREHSYIGTKNYTSKSNTKMDRFDIFIIDEASMIVNSDIEVMIAYGQHMKKKILFVGDKYQIPNPSQKYIKKNNFAIKADSSAFDVFHKFELVTNVRQSNDNPLIKLYNELRDAIKEERDSVIVRKTECINDKGVIFYNNIDKWLETIYDVYKNTKEPLHMIRILAYTNDTVKSNNMRIRRLFGREKVIEEGELLMGYNNVGYPDLIIENSQDYYVTKVTPTNNYCVYEYTYLVGDIVTVKETDTQYSVSIFIPDINHPNNKHILTELISRAEKVNMRNSTINDFKKYSHLKNRLFFIENIYKVGDTIMSESGFKMSHPLLNKYVSEYINDAGEGNRIKLSTELVKQLEEKYPDILGDRISDDKALSGSEKIGDRFCVIEKDIDYGYCITAHKSQGSSFHTVFIDTQDFEKMRNYWSYTMDCEVNVSKEKSQLKYVCYTRPTNFAHIL
jgi:hypothetical protein